MYGLKDDLILKIKNIFSSFPEVEEVVLYGSRAKGNYKNGSDIDLAIKGTRVDNSVLNKISSRFDDLYQPYTFDLTVYRYIKNKDLIDHIRRAGIIIYNK